MRCLVSERVDCHWISIKRVDTNPRELFHWKGQFTGELSTVIFYTSVETHRTHDALPSQLSDSTASDASNCRGLG